MPAESIIQAAQAPDGMLSQMADQIGYQYQACLGELCAFYVKDAKCCGVELLGNSMMGLIKTVGNLAKQKEKPDAEPE
jgi:hypothetical protein